MRSVLLPVFLLNCFILFGQKNIDKEIIVDLQKSYDNAIVKKDSAALRSLFHSDMVITGGDGSRRGTKEEIRDCTDPKYTVSYFKTLNIEVTPFENTAVLVGDIEWQLNNNGNPITLKRRITFTYARINKHWMIVAQHIGHNRS